MKIFLLSLTAALLIGLAGLCLRARPTASPAGTADKRAVLVELFTSEGCSDCPPADALLERLEAQQPVPGAEIIALEEHVDYWDQQGWRDPYSSSAWTERQREYAGAVRSGSIYTPEMVVDGAAGLIGSREREGLQAIARAVALPKTEISISPLRSENNKETFSIRVAKLQGAKQGDPAEVWLAITETGLHMAVTAGENSGRELRHASVLRKLQKLGTADARSENSSFAAEPLISFDSHWVRANLRAVAFVQEKKARRILGAATTTPGALNQ